MTPKSPPLALAVAQQENSDIVRTPGHSPEESARWYAVSPAGTRYRFPQDIAEEMEERYQAQKQERAEELQQVVDEGIEERDYTPTKPLLERIKERLEEAIGSVVLWLRSSLVAPVARRMW